MRITKTMIVIYQNNFVKDVINVPVLNIADIEEIIKREYKNECTYKILEAGCKIIGSKGIKVPINFGDYNNEKEENERIP